MKNRDVPCVYPIIEFLISWSRVMWKRNTKWTEVASSSFEMPDGVVALAKQRIRVLQ